MLVLKSLVVAVLVLIFMGFLATWLTNMIFSDVESPQYESDEEYY